MTAKLKLSSVPDDKPIKLTVELPPDVHRDLLDYGAVMARETGEPAPEPAKLIAPMLQRFMATDRAFTKARKMLHQPSRPRAPGSETA
ncbi:DUF2274 domain-containing protein [Pelagivirga sediminicola]|uniref:DUF2274 domain-containing protein n=1 Tax=Pelagivirga sediminicola TaxID=2170575 RepID=A0A2T7G2K9_9RHOB|nr:DUF2274 domain-containing protein [Pelagivirga sediminicola]PVA08661.1 DUF2274 domain-containing protein [Pelagivirga sediminicola]